MTSAESSSPSKSLSFVRALAETDRLDGIIAAGFVSVGAESEDRVAAVDADLLACVIGLRWIGQECADLAELTGVGPSPHRGSSSCRLTKLVVGVGAGGQFGDGPTRQDRVDANLVASEFDQMRS